MLTTHFSTELDANQLSTIVRQMVTMIDWNIWQRRIQTLKSHSGTNPFWQEFLLSRHDLELAFGDIRKHLRTTGRCPWPPRTAEEYRLYGFLATTVQVHAKLSPRGQANLTGGIRSSLEKEFGLGPRAFEMTTAARLMSQGFDIFFHDLETGGGYDFLAISGSTQIEVECKHISADIGRQIHRRKLHDLGEVLFPIFQRTCC